MLINNFWQWKYNHTHDEKFSGWCCDFHEEALHLPGLNNIFILLNTKKPLGSLERVSRKNVFVAISENKSIWSLCYLVSWYFIKFVQGFVK